MALSITAHAVKQVQAKGFALRDVVAVAQRPDFAYESRRYPGQEKRIGNGLCVVVDPKAQRIITVFEHLVRTSLRPDQIAV